MKEYGPDGNFYDSYFGSTKSRKGSSLFGGKTSELDADYSQQDPLPKPTDIIGQKVDKNDDGTFRVTVKFGDGSVKVFHASSAAQLKSILAGKV